MTVDITTLVYGTFISFFGCIGIIKSVAILFFKKELFLPVFDILFLIYRLIFGERHTFYQNQVSKYKAKVMKPFAVYYLIVMPFVATLGIFSIIGWIEAL